MGSYLVIFSWASNSVEDILEREVVQDHGFSGDVVVTSFHVLLGPEALIAE